MKILLIILFMAVVVSLAQVPTFDSSFFVKSDGKKIDAGYYGSPCMADWNGDGKKDMLLGIFSGGNIRFYENTGSNVSPSFSGFSTLRAGGKVLALPYG